MDTGEPTTESLQRSYHDLLLREADKLWKSAERDLKRGSEDKYKVKMKQVRAMRAGAKALLDVGAFLKETERYLPEHHRELHAVAKAAMETP